jgi:hypothetical protein
LSVDTKGNERVMQKSPDARTFKNYLHAVTWEEVSGCFVALLLLGKDSPKAELAIYKKNFNNFLTKPPKPSQDIIRIYSNYYVKRCAKKRLVDVALYSVKDECSYGYFGWDEILDMEVRVEDNLTLSDAEIVAVCLWGACDQAPGTEKQIEEYLNFLHEWVKTEEKN